MTPKEKQLFDANTELLGVIYEYQMLIIESDSCKPEHLQRLNVAHEKLEAAKKLMYFNNPRRHA